MARLGWSNFHAASVHLRNNQYTMSKLAEKRIALAKRVLETTDPGKLEALEEVLAGAVEFSPKQIAEFEAQLARIERGQELTTDWSLVRARLLDNKR